MSVGPTMPQTGSSRQEIVFIDTSVSDHANLQASVRAGLEVVLIDGASDGLAQIAAALAGRSGIGALHILSHGSEGALALGSGTIDTGSLDGHASALAAIRAALGEQADILLYGCETGKGSAGAAFVSRLAELTGADVAASTDLTGAAALGGNWVLERRHGTIEAAAPLSDAGAFAGVLAAAPADEDFTGHEDATGYPSPTRTVGGFTFSFPDGDGMDLDGIYSWIQDGPDFGFGATSGSALMFYPDGDAETGTLGRVTGRTVEMRSADGSTFSLASLILESAGGSAATTYTLKGYYQGTLVASATVDLASNNSGSAGISYALTPGALGGVVSFSGAGWKNIDSITFTATNQSGIGLAIDTIDIDTAVPFPSITSATYDAATGVLGVSGADLVNGDVIDATKLTLTGQNGATYTLTSGTATVSGATSFQLVLSAADQLYMNGLLNKNGSTPVAGAAYSLAAASGWSTTTSAPADTSGNAVTVSNVQAPTISAATYDANSNILSVTGSGLVHVAGNDITVSRLTLVGEGGASYTLTGAGVEITSATSFSVTLSGADQAALESIFNKNGSSSTGGTSYALSAADDWNGVVTGGDIAVIGASVTVSNVPVPTITSATYNGATGTLVVTGFGLTTRAGAANDIVASKLTITGEGGATYTLTGSSVEITSGTSFTIVLDSTDRAGVNALLDKAGTSSSGGTTYNLAAANGWAAGADAAIFTADTTGNGITVSSPADVTAPTVTSVSVPANATYVAGQQLDFTVSFSENVTLSGSGSTLGLTVGSTARSAAFLSAAGNTVTYRYTVQAGDADADGITVGALALGGSTIRDAAGNDAVTTLNSVGSTGNVLVDGVAPAVSGAISVPVDNLYLVGQTLTFTVTFSENVTLQGTPSTLGLTIGGAARSATVSATTANSISYSYTVQNGDNDTDGIAVNGIALNGGTIRDAAGNNASLALAGHLPALTGVLVDGGPPAVSGNIAVPANGSYGAGQTLSFTVTFDENVTVTGTDSTLGLTIGSTARSAVFASSSANSITYAYTVQAGDTDSNGIGIGAIAPGATTIRDSAGNDANLSLAGHLPSTANVLVDTTAPAVASVGVPSNATYAAGQELHFTVTFDENVTVTGSDSALALTIGGTARSATFLSSSGDAVTYRYTVQAGDADADGITVGALSLGASTIGDAAGNAAVLTLNSVGNTAGVLVDAVAPAVSGVITAPADRTYLLGDTLSFTVTFDENVTAIGGPSTLRLAIGSTARSASISAITANSITYTYTVQASDVDADGIAVTGIALNGSTIRDAAGNNANLALSGHLPPLAGVKVNGGPPSVSGNIAVPADGAYVSGQTLSFTVSFDRNVTVTGTDSVLGLTIGSTARNAVFDSKTANSITYAYTVQAGDLDNNGIAVGAITLNASTIKDTHGVDAVLSLAGHLPSTAGVRVDTVAPAVASVGVPADATYAAGQHLDFTVTFDENVTLSGSGSSLGLTIGATARSAAFLSSSGNTVTYRYTVQTGDIDADGIAIGALALGASTIRDAAGNSANLTLGGHLPPLAGIRVNAPAPSNPTPGTETIDIDGVPVQTIPLSYADGSSGRLTIVPVVTPSRVEQVGGSTVADIPLASASGGGVLLAAQVPVGIGLQSSGASQPKPAGNALTDLIREIKAHTTTASVDQNQLSGGGSGFVGGLSSDTPLLVQTIVVGGSGNDGTPLGLASQPQGSGAVKTALVLDTRGVTGGAHVELQNVEFAAIIGAATVTGGAGAQHVWGDGASQTIFLGEGDDVLHGGAGDDIVGSAGGNDMIYGDDGDDLIFGGEGNDLLDGGAGHDIARFSGRADGYTLRMANGKLVMTAQTGSDGTDTVVAVETLRFTGGHSMADEAVLARLYEGLLQRPASAAELAYWHDAQARAGSLHAIAAAILGSPESAQVGNPGSLAGDSAFVASLYQSVLGRSGDAAGIAFWTGRLAGGIDRASVALAFVNSTEKLDSTLDLDFNHSDVAVLVRMYNAMFGRVADEGGVNFWLDARAHGMSLGAIADAFAMSGEARGLLSATSDAAFIDLLFHNALERAPSAAEQALLQGQLQQGLFDRGQLLLNVAESAESVALVGSINTSVTLG